MVLSRETDYAIRIIRRLSDGELHVISEACEAEEVPRQFGYKIVNKLKAADILTCTKGRSGGCRLKANLHDLSLHDVMAAIGGNCRLSLSVGKERGETRKASKSSVNGVDETMSQLQDELNMKLKEIDIHSMVTE